MRRVGWLLCGTALLAALSCGAFPQGQGDASGTRSASPSIVPTPSLITCPVAAHPPAIGGLVYLKNRKEVLVFGGDDPTNSPTAETWTLSSGCWTKLSPAASPSARDSMTMAYDVVHGSVILYGGRAGGPGMPGTFLHDTWTWNGSVWTQVLAGGPQLINPASAYDPISKQVILFGPTQQGEAQTWAWTGATWMLLRPSVSPSARFSASMTFDPATGQLLLFGGGQTLGPIGETWTWNGSTWQQRHPNTSPSPRQLAALGPNVLTPGVVLYGGADFTRPYRDTWIWDGTSWSQVSPSHTPPAGVGAPVATDIDLELVASSGAVWAWSGTDWYQAA
jgi:hypothetical protein